MSGVIDKTMEKAKQKTIFLLVRRGFINKNILRSGTLTHLKESGSKIIIFFDNQNGKKAPEYLRKEFEDQNTIVEFVEQPKNGRLHRRFWMITTTLVYDVALRNLQHIRAGKSKTFFFFERLLFVPLSKSRLLKHIVRYIEQRLKTHNSYGKYFDQYKPDVVFSTSIISKFDVEFMKEARRRGIKTVSMPRGWDNVGATMYKFVPDRLIVQNELMKKDAVDLQDIPPELIYTTGFPQFDWYRRSDVIVSREEHFAKLGLDPKRKLIVWGSTGIGMSKDKNICDVIAQLVTSDKLAEPANLLIRAYPTDAKTGRFDSLGSLENVSIDDSYTISDFFRDHTDPSMSELAHFTNTIYHADLLITLCSTLTFDALCADTPIINTAFKGFYDKYGKDVSSKLYTFGHYKMLVDQNALDLVHSEAELIESIDRYLTHPEYKKAERKKALSMLCYKVDGKASKRIADVVLSLK